jgi:hypothetical protein
MLSAGAMTWSSKKQSIVTLSSTEAEYIAAAHAVKEVIWAHQLIHEIRPPGGAHRPI